MNKIKWNTEKRNISELKPAPYNPREMTEKQAEDLKASLHKFDLADPIVINKNNTIIGGHQRIRILSGNGGGEVDVRVPDRLLSEDEEKELNLRLNRNLGQWDYDALANFDNEMLLDVGFESDELDKIFQLDTKPEDDDVPDVPEEAKTKVGDIYQLGRHRLMCGDSTKVDDVERLMDGKKADMVFTDPPYGIKYKDLKGRFDEIKNDLSPQDAFIVVRDCLSLFSNIPIYVCCNWKSYADIRMAMEESALDVKACIVWDKGVRIQNLDKYAKQHEFILYSGRFGGQKTLDGDVWQLNRETRKDHPTAKPVELIERAVRYDSDVNSNIFDGFLGSGSTLIACEKTNRICYGMELDPKYCDVIIKRWEDYTNEKAVKIDA